MKCTAENHRCRISEIDMMLERLYMDNASGEVSDNRYEKMYAKFETEQARENRRQKVEIVYNNIGSIELENWQNTDT